MEYNIIKKNTCAITGHRILKKDFNENLLKLKLKEIISYGYDTFLIGMAKGFDMKCFEILLSLNSEIKIIACIPCKNQSQTYKENEKNKYNELLNKASEIIYLSEEYTNGCMQIRNRFMVDNSSLLFAYLYSNIGGTFYTVNYAKKKNKKIIYL